MPLARQNFEELGLPAGPYTHAIRHGQTVYTSGFTAFGTPAQADSAARKSRRCSLSCTRSPPTMEDH